MLILIAISQNCLEGKVKQYTQARACVPAQFRSRVQLFAAPWTTAHQVPVSMGFSRHEYCSGLPFPSPGDLPNSGNESTSCAAIAVDPGSTPDNETRSHRMHQRLKILFSSTNLVWPNK